MRRRPAERLLLLGLAATLLISGCWDYRDIDNRALAIMIGIDRGEKKSHQVCVQIALPSKLKIARGGAGGGGGGERDKPYRVMCAEGAGVALALDDIRASLTQDLDTSHLKIVVVGAEMARAGLDQIDWVARNLQMMNTAFITVARGRSEEVVRAETESEEIPAFYLYHAYSGEFTRSRAVTPQHVWQVYYRDLMSGAHDPVLPAVTGRKYGLNFQGYGVFRGQRLAGWVDGLDAETLGMFLGRRISGTLQTSFPGQPEAVTGLFVNNGSVKRAVELREGQPVLRISMRLSGDMRGLRTGVAVLNTQIERKLEEGYARDAERRVRSLIRKLQEMGTDPLGFRERLRRLDPSHPAVTDEQIWLRMYAEAPLEVRAEVTMVTPGTKK